MLKIKLFTHTDLDGIGAVAVLKHYFNTDVAKISYKKCSYGRINDEVAKFLKYDYADYDLVFITDISVDENVAAALDFLHKKNKNIQLIDHHETALWLNEYDWAKVVVDIDGEPESGTSLLNYYLKETFVTSESGLTSQIDQESIDEFAETVRLYDTWEWDARGLTVPRQLNDLLFQYGSTQFIHRFSYNPVILFNGFEQDLITKVSRERDYYVKLKLEHQLYSIAIHVPNFIRDHTDVEAYGEKEAEAVGKIMDAMGTIELPVTFVAVERYHSEVGNAIAKNGGGIAILLDFHRGTMSFRTASDFPVNQLAILFGGGGHAKSAGAPISKSLLKAYWDAML